MVSLHLPFSFTDDATLKVLPPHIPSFMAIEKSLSFRSLMSKSIDGFRYMSTLFTVCPSSNLPLSSGATPSSISSTRTPPTTISSMVGYISTIPFVLSSLSKYCDAERRPICCMFTESMYGLCGLVEKICSLPVGFTYSLSSLLSEL